MSQYKIGIWILTSPYILVPRTVCQSDTILLVLVSNKLKNIRLIFILNWLSVNFFKRFNIPGILKVHFHFLLENSFLDKFNIKEYFISPLMLNRHQCGVKSLCQHNLNLCTYMYISLRHALWCLLSIDMKNLIFPYIKEHFKS